MSTHNKFRHIFHNFPPDTSSRITSVLLKRAHKNKYDIHNLFKLNFNLFPKKKPKALTILIHQLKTFYFGENGLLVSRIKWLKSLLYPSSYFRNNKLSKKINIGKLTLYELIDHPNIYNNREVECKKGLFRRSSHFIYDSNFKNAIACKHKHKKSIFLSQDLSNINNYIMNITNTFNKNNILLKSHTPLNRSTPSHINTNNLLSQFDNIYKRSKRKVISIYKRNERNVNIMNRPRTANMDIREVVHKGNSMRRCWSTSARCGGVALSKDNTKKRAALLKVKLNDISRENGVNEKKIRRVFSWGNSPLSVKIANFICNPVATAKNQTQVIISQTEGEIKKDVEIALDISLKGEADDMYKVIVNKLKNERDAEYVNKVLDLSNSVMKCNESTAYKFGDIIKKEYHDQTQRERKCLTDKKESHSNVYSYWKQKMMIKDKMKYKYRKLLHLK